ncbi:MAG: ROK family protein [Bacteroidales bacterium]|nr:ROK family protein [Bacteroidales bacterium]
MWIFETKTIVLLLDAGGTNLVFTALQYGKEIVSPITKPTNGHDLELCLKTIIVGFEEVMKALPMPATAISFAFPGPADYPNGIIGDLNNLPGFRGGVPLGPILQEHFGIPVFINNDGDLFAYGEALAGILPEMNRQLQEHGNPKRYHNLIGITLGTGMGAGVVRNGELYLGDNSIGSEAWILGNRYTPDKFAEVGISTEAIKKHYLDKTGTAGLMPKDIFEIATGKQAGNASVAREAFDLMGRNLGEVVANLITLYDGIVVLGGGIAAASELFMPALMNELHGKFVVDGKVFPRLVQKVNNYGKETDRAEFLRKHSKELPIPGTNKTVSYDPVPRVAIAISSIGASTAIALGAYSFALNKIG